MSFPLEIIPKLGLGHVLFGATPGEVERELGKPARALGCPAVGEFIGFWMYDEPACTLFFNDGAFWNVSLAGTEKSRLVMITAISPAFTLFGNRAIGQAEETIRSKVAAYGLGNATEHSIAPYECKTLANKHLYFPDALLSLYLLDAAVSEVAWQMPHEGPPPSLHV